MNKNNLTPLGAARAASLTLAEIEAAIRAACTARELHARTTAAYLDWHFRFLVFHGRRHPALMGAPEVGAFLSYLSSERKVAAASLHQARFALSFVYEKVLGISLERLRFRQLDAPARVPRVCEPAAIAAVLDHVAPEWQLAARLLYGCGLRLQECLQLRHSDLELDFQRIAIRLPDGKLDRHVPLPPSLLPAIQGQLAASEAALEAACQREDFLGAPARCPQPCLAGTFSRTIADAFLFPAQQLERLPDQGRIQRHLSESGLQKAVKAAFQATEVCTEGSCSTLRHSFAAHQLAEGHPLEVVQGWLGQKGLRYVRLYVDKREAG